jgi:hypothetical protein
LFLEERVTELEILKKIINLLLILAIHTEQNSSYLKTDNVLKEKGKIT